MTSLILLPILAPLAASAFRASRRVAHDRPQPCRSYPRSQCWDPVRRWVSGRRGPAGGARRAAARRRAVGDHAHQSSASSATLTTWASIGYIDAELAHGHTDRRGARLYGTLTPAFLAAMVVAVSANNIGLIWVRRGGHHRDHRVPGRASPHPHRAGSHLEIRGDLLGRHRHRVPGHRAGGTSPRATPAPPSADALNLDVLLAHAAHLDPAVTRLAAGCCSSGTAQGRPRPFHTWLADAHSQAQRRCRR